MLDSIVTLASIPAIVAMVNLLKGLGVQGKWSLVAAVVLGVAFSVLGEVFGGNTIFEAAQSGLLLGLGAAGLYDVTTGPKVPDADYSPLEEE